MEITKYLFILSHRTPHQYIITRSRTIQHKRIILKIIPNDHHEKINYVCSW